MTLVIFLLQLSSKTFTAFVNIGDIIVNSVVFMCTRCRHKLLMDLNEIDGLVNMYGVLNVKLT